LPKPAPKKVATAHAQYFVPFSFWMDFVEAPSVVMRVSAAASAEFTEIFEDFGSRMGELIL